MLGKMSKLRWGKQSEEASNKTPPADTPASQEKDNSDEPSRTLINDSAEKKRLAAVPQVKDTQLLLKVSREDNSDKVRNAAARQYARSLAGGDQTQQLLENYAGSSDSRHLALLITAHHADESLRTHGLSLFNDDNDYGIIAEETRFHDTRDQVTEKITSLEVVDAVWRKIKTKDKVVARKLKDRIQAHQSANRKQAEQRTELEKILEEMDRLANGAWSPNFITRYDLFVSKWKALDFEVPADDQRNFSTLQQQASEKVEKNREQQELQDALKADIEKLASISQSLINSGLTKLPGILATCVPETNAIRARWLDHINLQKTDDNQRSHIERGLANTEKSIQQAQTAHSAFSELSTDAPLSTDALKANQKRLNAIIKSVRDAKTEPVYAADFPSLLQSIESKLKQQTKVNAELKASVQKQFGSLNSAISASKWGPAKSIHERLEKKIARLPEKDRIHLSDKLAGFEKRLNELGDWKQFATEPKLESLCEEMEKLPSHKLSPKDQADRIKLLQDQWKAMGASPAQDKYWPRFKTAADTAFAPCAEYFANRRKEKETKLGQREEILKMLEAYEEQVNWDNPDWRLVEKTIRTAKNEWRKLRVFDRKATAPQEAAFTAALAALDEKLAPAYERGKEEKEALIERVKTLGEGEINQHCINQVKRLQSQWRRTGIVKRADDQRLWKAFNQACSEIYDVHRGRQREQYAASVEHVKRAREIIKELRQAGSGESELDEKNLLLLQEEFQSLPEFPERDQKFLFRDYNRALEGLDKQREMNVESALKLQLNRLHTNASLCDQLEALAGQSPESINLQINALLEDWDEGNKTDNLEWKKSINLRRDSIVAHLQAGTLPDFDANTHARRLLCIDLEILLDKETPAEDKALRMQHQLNQLQQGMTAATIESRQDQLQALKVKWLTAFPAAADQRDKLNARFETAFSH